MGAKWRVAREPDGGGDRASHWKSKFCAYGVARVDADRRARDRAGTNSAGAAKDGTSPSVECEVLRGGRASGHPTGAVYRAAGT